MSIRGGFSLGPWSCSVVFMALVLVASCVPEDAEPDSSTVRSDALTLVVEGEREDPDAVSGVFPLADQILALGQRPDPEPDFALRAERIVPMRGPIEGGTPFVIEGENFTESTVVFIGGELARIDLVEGRIIGQTPPSAAAGLVDIKILDAERGNSTLVDGFTYTVDVAIESALPSSIPERGLVEVTFQGRGFDENTRFTFDGVSALRHVFIDSETIRVLVPAHDAGAVTVRVTSRDDTVVFDDVIEYVAEPRIDIVEPASGPLDGGIPVAIYGEGFAPGMTVSFGRAQADVLFVSQDGTLAQVLAPANAPGVTAVSFETLEGEAAREATGFHYTDQPGLAAVAMEPVESPARGNTPMKILVHGLEANDDVDVFVGGQLATLLTRGEGFVIVMTPASTRGLADVTVETADASSTVPTPFTYVRGATLRSVAPTEGDAAGDETVTLDGSGFSGITGVRFGGLDAAFDVVSDTRIIVTTPAHPTGRVDVVLERGEHDVAIAGRRFEYVQEPVVFNMTPARGSIAGNTYVEMLGQGFYGDIQVTFGGEPAQSVEILDEHVIAVRTPRQASGPMDVLVTRRDATVQTPEPYIYFNPAARFGGAWGGPIVGALNVTVYSSNGEPLEGAFVMLSTREDTEYKGLTNEMGMITLSGPDVYGEQTVTAIMKDHSSTIVQQVNAENITIILNEDNAMRGQGNFDSPQPATITGQLRGLDKLAFAGPNKDLVAYISTTKVNRYSFGSNTAQISRDGNYTLTTRLGDLAVVAIGGLQDRNTGIFTPLRMGVVRGIFASEGGSYTADIRLDIELGSRMRVKMNEVPTYSLAGPNETRFQVWMDFGFEGLFTGLPAYTASGIENLVVLEDLPSLSGQLSDVTYFVEGGAYTRGGVPYSIGVKRTISDISQDVELPGLLDVPRVTSPFAGQTPVDGLIEWSYDSPRKPDMYRVVVFRPVPGVGNIPYWEAFVPGDQTSVKIPSVPDLDEFYEPGQAPRPFLNQELPLYIYAIERDGLTFEEFTYNDFDGDRWDASSLFISSVRL